jgi:hypothetical protein
MERRVTLLPALLVLLPLTGAAGADLRQMYAEPGEWLVTIGGTLIPHTRAKACYRGPDAIADIVTSRLSNCSRKAVEIGESTATIDAECSVSGAHVIAHATVTPTGDSAWRAVSAVRIENVPPGAQAPAIELEMTIAAKRLGPCPEEKKPS